MWLMCSVICPFDSYVDPYCHEPDRKITFMRDEGNATSYLRKQQKYSGLVFFCQCLFGANERMEFCSFT